MDPDDSPDQLRAALLERLPVPPEELARADRVALIEGET